VKDYLAAKDLQVEQRYRSQRFRHHNRYLHGWGVVCGLHVAPDKDAGRPWAVLVCPGYAIGCCGEAIEVRARALVDVRDYLWRRPQKHGVPEPVACVGIRYSEQQVKPVPANPPQCGCHDTTYQSSRIQDSHQVDIVWGFPETADTEGLDLCEQRLPPCPECPDNTYVILACITLPASEGDPITVDHVDNLSCRQRM
jgi:hypothetical protein